MKKLTLIAAGLLAAGAVHAETTTSAEAAPMPYGAPYAMPSQEQLEAHQDRMRAFHEAQVKAHQAAMEQMAERRQQAFEQLTAAGGAPFQAPRFPTPSFEAPTFEAPDFRAPDFSAPLSRAEVDALFEERRKEMDAHFAKAMEEMEAARADYPAERPAFPAAYDNARYQEALKRYQAGRDAARERMNALRAEAAEARANAYPGPVM